MCRPNFYHVLEVDEGATPEEIKRSYRRLALQFHPDKNSSPDAEEKFKLILCAYETLADPIKRRNYDRDCESESFSYRPQQKPQKKTSWLEFLRGWSILITLAFALLKVIAVGLQYLGCVLNWIGKFVDSLLSTLFQFCFAWFGFQEFVVNVISCSCSLCLQIYHFIINTTWSLGSISYDMLQSPLWIFVGAICLYILRSFFSINSVKSQREEQEAESDGDEGYVFVGKDGHCYYATPDGYNFRFATSHGGGNHHDNGSNNSRRRRRKRRHI